MNFQAAIGPNMQVLHLFAMPAERPVKSICNAVVIVHVYRGVVSIGTGRLCKRCFKLVQDQLPAGEVITAELIGVSEIIE